MRTFEILSQVHSSREIGSYLQWHIRHAVPLMLLNASSDVQRPARLLGVDSACTALEVSCSGMAPGTPRTHEAYALIGSTPAGAHFLATGKVAACAGSAAGFRLSFPQWIDLAQSRDCYRCAAPPGHTLQFTVNHPRPARVVCSVRNLSLGGLALHWNAEDGDQLPSMGSLVHSAVLMAGRRETPLGELRVAHCLPDRQGRQGGLLGLELVREAPRPYCLLVLDAQRALALA